MEICPIVALVYDSIQTTVVLGWPIEHAALSEFVPTPDESLIMSLVSPMLLSKRGKKEEKLVEIPFQWEKLQNIINS